MWPGLRYSEAPEQRPRVAMLARPSVAGPGGRQQGRGAAPGLRSTSAPATLPGFPSAGTSNSRRISHPVSAAPPPARFGKAGTENYLSDLTEKAYARNGYTTQIRVLRTGFITLLDGQTREDQLALPRRNAPPLEIIQHYMLFAIQVGGAAYDAGDPGGCFSLTLCSPRGAWPGSAKSRRSVNAETVPFPGSPPASRVSTKTWTLRRAFDEVLDYE